MTSLNLNYPIKILSLTIVSLGLGASTSGFGEVIIQFLAGRYLAAEAHDTCLGTEYKELHETGKGEHGKKSPNIVMLFKVC